jgi:hypothetical protein
MARNWWNEKGVEMTAKVRRKTQIIYKNPSNYHEVSSNAHENKFQSKILVGFHIPYISQGLYSSKETCDPQQKLYSQAPG